MKVLRSIRVASRRRVAFSTCIWVSPNLAFTCAHKQSLGSGQCSWQGSSQAVQNHVQHFISRLDPALLAEGK